MRNLKNITTLALILLVINACKKSNDALFNGLSCSGNCFVLRGKLKDSAMNLGLTGAEIKFYYRDITGTFSNKTFYLGSSITNEDGNYSFTFEGSRFRETFGYYYVEAFKGSMFGDNPFYPNRVAEFYLDTSLYNIPFIQNFPFFRPATIKVRVIATSVTNYRYLTVGYEYGKAGNGIVFNGGRIIDTTIIWKTAGDLKTFVTADAVGNGVNIKKRDSLIIPTDKIKQIEIRL